MAVGWGGVRRGAAAAGKGPWSGAAWGAWLSAGRFPARLCSARPCARPRCVQERRTQLFSATMTSKVAKLQRACLRDPAKVEVASKYSTVDTLRQQYMFVPAKYKDCYLTFLLTGGWVGGWLAGWVWRALAACGVGRSARQRAVGTSHAATTHAHTLTLHRLTPTPPHHPHPAELAGATSIIFTRTCDSTRRIALMLRNLGFGAVPIHGQMSQPKRLGALNKFKVGAGAGAVGWAAEWRGQAVCATLRVAAVAGAGRG